MQPQPSSDAGTERGQLARRLRFDDQYAATIGRRSAARQVLLFMGIRACIDPFELQRVALLAEVWDAQVTVVDTPGYGHGGARLTPAARQVLRRGSFVPVAEQMVDAAQRHHPVLARAPVNVVGYSMGASLAAAALATGKLDVEAVTLVEPVAIRRWRVGTLLNTVRHENSFTKQYLEDNVHFRESTLPSMPQPHRRPRRSDVDLAHLGAGIARGRLLADMLRATENRCVPVHVIHGRESRLSRADDVARFIDECSSAGIAADDAAIAGRHALWHSLTTVESVARMALARWETQPSQPADLASPDGVAVRQRSAFLQGHNHPHELPTNDFRTSPASGLLPHHDTGLHLHEGCHPGTPGPHPPDGTQAS